MSKEEFCKDYKALCLKHNMYIDSCGCCNGPSTISKEEWESWKSSGNKIFEEVVNENVRHLLESE